MVGEVLEEAWRLYTQNSSHLIATAGIIYGFLALVDALVDSVTGARWLFTAVSILVTVVGVFWLQGALVILVDDLKSGRPRLPIGELFGRVQPKLATLVPAGLLAATGISAGLVALIVPGLVLLTFWSLVTPAIVLEGRGVVASFRRSFQLVRGSALRVFAVILVTVVIAAIVGVVITTLLVPLPDFFDLYLASVVANSITVPFVALAWTVMYFALRGPAEPPARVG